MPRKDCTENFTRTLGSLRRAPHRYSVFGRAQTAVLVQKMCGATPWDCQRSGLRPSRTQTVASGFSTTLPAGSAAGREKFDLGSLAGRQRNRRRDPHLRTGSIGQHAVRARGKPAEKILALPSRRGAGNGRCQGAVVGSEQNNSCAVIVAKGDSRGGDLARQSSPFRLRRQAEREQGVEDVSRHPARFQGRLQQDRLHFGPVGPGLRHERQCAFARWAENVTRSSIRCIRPAVASASVVPKSRGA